MPVPRSPRRPAPRVRPAAAAAATTLAALALSACGGDGEPTASTTTPTGTTPPAAGLDAAQASALRDAGCRAVPAPAAREPEDLEAPAALPRGERASVRIRTSCGAFTVRLDTRRYPRTAGVFAGLARRGFYDGLGFHRVVPGALIQGGDPSGDGTGGPGFSVVEAPRSSASYPSGTVAMAKTAADPPGASGSQFFVVSGDDLQLPPEYAIAGRVTSGMDVVRRIASLGLAAGDGPPAAPVVVQRATVTGG